MLLSRTEIEQLTGYGRPSAQRRWLAAHGWRFAVDAAGQPQVALAEFNRRMVGGRSTSQEPDWEALNGPATQT